VAAVDDPPHAVSVRSAAIRGPRRRPPIVAGYYVTRYSFGEGHPDARGAGDKNRGRPGSLAQVVVGARGVGPAERTSSAGLAWSTKRASGEVLDVAMNEISREGSADR
jgi:hypothetical protein